MTETDGAPWWQQVAVITLMITFGVLLWTTSTPRAPEYLCHGGTAPGHTYVCDAAGRPYVDPNR